MKTGTALIVLALAVAGCGRGVYRSDGLDQQRAACAGGDYKVCAEIGHQARAAQGGTTLEQQQRKIPMPLSEPIID